jgi:integrase
VIASRRAGTVRVVPVRSFRKAWSTACRLAGCPGKIPHDFRRTAVRNLERSGVSRSAAMAMVGHRTQSVYARYAIVAEGDLRRARDQLAAQHEALTPPAGPTAPTVVPLMKAAVAE